ncbi:hypothetical protein [Brasilonema bromeliae]|uniref:hypothetical protein n=1 Tax=Brasilonema bromeliae TaxID=383615 RepID=UPI00145DFAE1|nr:hypothetical protein [Brasilonema bromeliae]
MLEKFVQAAIITFLLHLLAGLSPTTIKTEATPAFNTLSAPIARTLSNNFE